MNEFCKWMAFRKEERNTFRVGMDWTFDRKKGKSCKQNKRKSVNTYIKNRLYRGSIIADCDDSLQQSICCEGMREDLGVAIAVDVEGQVCLRGTISPKDVDLGSVRDVRGDPCDGHSHTLCKSHKFSGQCQHQGGKSIMILLLLVLLLPKQKQNKQTNKQTNKKEKKKKKKRKKEKKKRSGPIARPPSQGYELFFSTKKRKALFFFFISYVLFVCLFTRRRENSWKLCTLSCGIGLKKTVNYNFLCVLIYYYYH